MRISRANCRAFTLVEIMVAIAVFSMVLGAIYSSWILLIRSTQLAKDVAAQAQRQRIALRTIEDALMSVQSFQASQKYYSFVVENGDTPFLSFASRVPEVFPRNGKFISPNTGKEFNLRRLAFSLQPGERGQKNLVLRQYPVLMDMDEDEQQFPLILARNVRKFTVECWDKEKQEWTDEWLNTNSIPALVRLGLVMGGNTTGGQDAPDTALMRLLSLPSDTMPAAAQNGQGGGPGAPGTPGGGPQIQIPTPNPGAAPGRRPTTPGGRQPGRP